MKHPTAPNAISVVLCVCSLLGIQNSLSEDHHGHDHDHSAPAPPAERRAHVDAEELAKLLTAENATKAPAPELKLPPLPDGVEELGFHEFFQNPVGPRGLEPSARLLSLNGKRVRILGFVAEMERSSKRDIIFAPLPLKPQPEEYGLADEIPATHVLATIPGNPDEQVPLVAGPLLLTGTLSVGNPAQGSEFSFVRLLVDSPAAK